VESSRARQTPRPGKTKSLTQQLVQKDGLADLVEIRSWIYSTCKSISFTVKLFISLSEIRQIKTVQAYKLLYMFCSPIQRNRWSGQDIGPIQDPEAQGMYQVVNSISWLWPPFSDLNFCEFENQSPISTSTEAISHFWPQILMPAITKESRHQYDARCLWCNSSRHLIRKRIVLPPRQLHQNEPKELETAASGLPCSLRILCSTWGF